MAKARIVPWMSKKDGDGSVPLYLVIQHQRQRSTLALPVRIKPGDWNPAKHEVRKSNRHHAKLNPYLKSILLKTEDAFVDAIVEGRSIDTAEIKRLVAGDDKAGVPDFLEDFAARIEEFERRGQHGSVDAYRPALAKLSEYCEQVFGKPELRYNKFDLAFIRGYDTYLATERGNKPNTIAKNLGYMKTILNRVMDEGRFPRDKNPFLSYKFRKEKADKPKLTFEEICALEDAQLSGKTADVRNYFVFAFHAAGMRISDVLTLQGKDIEQEGDVVRLSYTMLKTGQVAYPMVLGQTPLRILRQYGWPDIGPDEYVFPEMPAGISPKSEEGFKARKTITAKVNKLLKSAARKAGIETTLTTHVARHSWTYHLDRNNVPVQRISDTLSHGDLKTTQAYVKKVRSVQVDEQLLAILKRPAG
jgi:site-specific recombinase XerD